MPELLIITNSYDATTDVLLDKLDGSSVFRLNFDQILTYRIRFNEIGFDLSDPTGRTVNSRAVKKAYWRKPFHGEHEEQHLWSKYVDAEMRYFLAELVNFLWTCRKLVLVEPFSERRTGKLMQLRCAQEFFTVPAYEFALNDVPGIPAAVVKSLSSEPIGDRVLYTTRVNSDALDLRYPWFVEQYLAARHDVTVVFVRGQMFSFSLDRSDLKELIDWREKIGSEQEWIRHFLPDYLSVAIAKYMGTLKLDYGRLDFLLDEQDRYWFCEVNPNGQFAWLDLNGEHGLLDAVVNEISPNTQRYPIPNHHPLESSAEEKRH